MSYSFVNVHKLGLHVCPLIADPFIIWCGLLGNNFIPFLWTWLCLGLFPWIPGRITSWCWVLGFMKSAYCLVGIPSIISTLFIENLPRNLLCMSALIFNRNMSHSRCTWLPPFFVLISQVLHKNVLVSNWSSTVFLMPSTQFLLVHHQCPPFLPFLVLP